MSQKIKGLESAGGASSVVGRASHTLEHLGQEIAQGENKQAGRAPLNPNAGKPIPVEIRRPGWQLLEHYRSIMETVSEPLSTAVIVLVFLVFIMLQREDLRDRLIRLIGPKRVERSTAAMDDAGSRLSRYFLTQTIVNSIFGCVIGGGLALIGVPNAVLFGALATLMRFVPFVGSFIAAAIPLVLAAAIEPGWARFFWTLGLYVAGEAFVGQVVEPWAYGHTTGLSPFAVIVSATFWTWLWGPIGLVMAVPLTACFVVLAKHVERFEFLYILLTDAPALTAPQSFYQRMLAGNTEEAAHDAERYLKKNSLCQYYSEVAMPGLTLAHQDWERGVLSEARLLELGEAVEELIEDLADYADVTPGHQKNSKERKQPPGTPHSELQLIDAEHRPQAWRSAQILAMGGRTPIDAAGAAILVQLLNKHGIPAHAAPLASTGRSFFRDGVAPCAFLICVSYFGSAAAHAHIRAMARRLHRAQPEAHILFCCWEGVDQDANIYETIASAGALGCVSTLEDAVAEVRLAIESEAKRFPHAAPGREAEATR